MGMYYFTFRKTDGRKGVQVQVPQQKQASCCCARTRSEGGVTSRASNSPDGALCRLSRSASTSACHTHVHVPR